MPAEQIDWTTAGGYLAAGGLLLAWLGRAFGVHGRLVRFEATVIERLDNVEARQDRMSERFFAELRDLRQDLRAQRGGGD